jgi:thiol-disulfide isomerase/thioredoxin
VSRLARWLPITLIALAGLVAGLLAYLWLQGDVAAEGPAQVLLATRLKDVEGVEQPLAQWKGKILVVNFWATWCPPCLKEIPEFVRLQDKYAREGVQFVGIALDDRAKVAEFAARLRINYPLLLAGADGLTLAQRAGNRLGGLPFTVIIDREGRTAKVELGVLDERKLTPILQALL